MTLGSARGVSPLTGLELPPARILAASLGAAAVVGVGVGLGTAAGLAALIGVAALAAAAQWPHFGAPALVAVVPAVSGFARGFPVPGLRISELVVAGIGLAILCSHRVRAVPWRAFDWWALAYAGVHAAVTSLNVLLRGEPLSTEGLGVAVGPFAFFLLYRAVVVGLHDEAARRRALRWLLWASVPVSAIALLQTIGVRSARDLAMTVTAVDLDAQWAFQQLPRAVGLFPHWQVLAGYLFVIVLLSGALVLQSSASILTRGRATAIAGLAALALIGTLSITPITATALGLLLLAVRYRRLQWALAGIGAVALVALLAFPSLLQRRLEEQFGAASNAESGGLIASSIAYRFDIWTSQYIPALRDHLVTGYGPDLPPTVTWQFTESMYVTLIQRGGIVLLVVFGALMAALAFAAVDRARQETDPAFTAIEWALVLIVLLLAPMHLVMPYFVNTGLPHLLWAVAGIVLAGGARASSPPAPRARSRTTP